MGPVVAVNDDVRMDAADNNNIVGGSSSISSLFGIVGTVTLRG